MGSAHFQLTDLTTITASAVQDRTYAIDVLAYKTLVAEVRKHVASGGTGYFQHSATLEEAAFVDIASPTFDLASTATQVIVFTNTLRYVRWKASGVAASCTFMIDIIANEN